jgi:hypothetical protein
MEVTFEICELPIVRGSWYRAELPRLRSYRFPPNMPDVLGLAGADLPRNTLSLGPEDPRGALPAYAVTAIFARNIRIHFNESNRAIDSLVNDVRGGGGVRYGFFRLGGGASSSVSRSNYKSHFEDGTLVADGMQIIGFKNYILPKAPNPDPAISESEWVTDIDALLDTLTPA